MKNYYNKKLDFDLEHKYFVAELESKYKHWFSIRGFYKLFSNYGISIIRPILGIMIVLILLISFSNYYFNHECKIEQNDKIVKCFNTENIIVRTIVPLNFNCIKEEKVDKKIESDGKINHWLLLVLFLQTILNISFLFLIGLALRNKFKIR